MLNSVSHLNLIQKYVIRVHLLREEHDLSLQLQVVVTMTEFSLQLHLVLQREDPSAHEILLFYDEEGHNPYIIVLLVHEIPLADHLAVLMEVLPLKSVIQAKLRVVLQLSHRLALVLLQLFSEKQGVSLLGLFLQFGLAVVVVLGLGQPLGQSVGTLVLGEGELQ